MYRIGKTIVLKEAGLALALLAFVVQFGFWSGLNGTDNYPSSVLMHYWIGKIDQFEALMACLFLGFIALWGLLLMQGTVKKEALISLLVLLAIAGGFSLITVPYGTTKGWYWMGYSNTFTFAVNGAFALMYLLLGRVKKI